MLPLWQPRPVIWQAIGPTRNDQRKHRKRMKKRILSQSVSVSKTLMKQGGAQVRIPTFHSLEAWSSPEFARLPIRDSKGSNISDRPR